MQALIDQLNPQQREAVVHPRGPLMVVAGAGSGKTRVITCRIAFLAREMGIPLYQILAVTFTNKAAREMRQRVCSLMGMPDTPGLPIGTFHSRCAMILRRDADAAGLDKNFTILDENDQRQAIRTVLKEMGIKEKQARPAHVQSTINLAKMRLLRPADLAEAEEFSHDQIPYEKIYENYQQVLEKSKCLDFEDLIMRTVLLFQEDESARKRWTAKYRYLLVDEYQDTNHSQFLLTKLLAEDHGEVCIVGDEDQSIYSWRGAEISNLLDFKDSFPALKIVKLEQNYRSSGNILKAASGVIAHNEQRIGKVLFTDQGEGEALTYMRGMDEELEAEQVTRQIAVLLDRETDPEEIAIFYRSHRLSRALEDAIRERRLPYRIVGGTKFYDRREIKDLIAFLQLAVNPHNDLAFARVVNTPTRGVGKKTLDDIARTSIIENTSYYDAAKRMLERGEIKGRAKGGLNDFTGWIAKWARMERTHRPAEILDDVLKQTSYKENGVGDLDKIEADIRLENIAEFQGVVQEHIPEVEEHQLAQFLNNLSLDRGDDQDDGKRKISLMTIHNAKGLEFDCVFIVGLNEGTFPNSRVVNDQELAGLEEERRLFYVALTRARKRIWLSRPMRHRVMGYYDMANPSRFLNELPTEVFDETSQEALHQDLPYDWGRKSSRDAAAPAGGNGFFSGVRRGSGSTTRPKPKEFTPGDAVIHKYMGRGIVEKVWGRPGFERIRIAFDDGREQEFVIKFAPLTPGD